MNVVGREDVTVEGQTDQQAVACDGPSVITWLKGRGACCDVGPDLGWKRLGCSNYSDYHAFIEGSLRSAVHVLTQIPNQAWPQGDMKAALAHIPAKALSVQGDITDAIGTKYAHPRRRPVTKSKKTGLQ